MPILRKIIKVGNSKAVIIPDDWFKYQEKILGRQIEEVGMEINDVITIRPIPQIINEKPKSADISTG